VQRALAMALVDNAASGVDTKVACVVRGRTISAVVVPLPFYRRAR
jgi:glycine cleavage system aminomethyltransferase T